MDGPTTMKENEMTYYVGQPVLSNMSEGDAYVQEYGPHKGKPVVRGIITKNYEDGYYLVWWENCARGYTCDDDDIEPVE